MNTPDPGATPDKALVVVDLQDGFEDPFWGRTNTPNQCRENCVALVNAFQARRLQVALVRHDSTTPESPLRPDRQGNRLDRALHLAVGDVLVTKSVNSAFYGDPDLHRWLQERHVRDLVICGIQTNMCVETTARMAGNLATA